MKKIRAKIGKNFVWFVEEDTENKNSFKSGRLEPHDFFKWLEDKNRVYDELVILIVKNPDKQEVSIA